MRNLTSSLLAILLAIALVATGCGSDDTGGDGGTDSAGTETTETTSESASDDTASDTESDTAADTEPAAEDDPADDSANGADQDDAEQDDAEQDDAADDSEVASGSGEIIRIGLQLEPPTMDLTASPAAAIPQVLLYNVYETLVRLDADGLIHPLLAESYEISDDGLSYTFVLREGVSFHNGDPLTASDVAWSLNNVRDEANEHPFATTMAPVASVEAPDDNTVVITLDTPSANLLFFLAQGQGVVLNEEFTGEMENSANGTGPFVFDAWVPGDSIQLSRHGDYWGDSAALGGAVFRYIPDENALTNAMLAEDIDLIAGVSAPELLDVFEVDDRFVVSTGQTYGEVVLSLNGRVAPLDDIRVRQAVTHAIDRQAIVDLAYAGYGTPIGSFSTPLDPWFKDLTGVYPYDPDRARELLSEAGAEGATLRLVLPPTSYASRSGEIIQSQLDEVGLNVEITNVEWPVWLEDVFSNYDFDMSIVAHVEANDLAQYGNAEYYWGNDSPAVADLVAEADAAPDAATRNDLYGQALDEITAQAADNWLFVLPALSVADASISGYSPQSPSLALDLTGVAMN